VRVDVRVGFSLWLFVWGFGCCLRLLRRLCVVFVASVGAVSVR